MTYIQIDLPDTLADEAARAGLLAPERIAALLREQLKAQRLNDLRGARAKLAANPLPPMSHAEIAAEIAAYRADRH